MTQYRNRKYKIKGSLHVAENFRGEIIRTEVHQARGLQVTNERYQCLGFLFTCGDQVDPQDLNDFKHMQWYRIELKSDLKMGALPSGLLIRCPGGEVRDVRESELVPLDGQLGEVG
jgi:hypothetical protein